MTDEEAGGQHRHTEHDEDEWSGDRDGCTAGHQKTRCRQYRDLAEVAAEPSPRRVSQQFLRDRSGRSTRSWSVRAHRGGVPGGRGEVVEDRHHSADEEHPDDEDGQDRGIAEMGAHFSDRSAGPAGRTTSGSLRISPIIPAISTAITQPSAKSPKRQPRLICRRHHEQAPPRPPARWQRRSCRPVWPRVAAPRCRGVAPWPSAGMPPSATPCRNRPASNASNDGSQGTRAPALLISRLVSWGFGG